MQTMLVLKVVVKNALTLTVTVIVIYGRVQELVVVDVQELVLVLIAVIIHVAVHVQIHVEINVVIIVQ